MAKDEKFMFYETFLQAIDILPEDKRAEACYKFCRYGVYGELPEDEALKMFCIGVSCSVQKYHGSGGAREGAGRPKKENQINQIIQKNQINQIEQTQTQTQTKTKNKTKNKTETETQIKTQTQKPTKKEIEDYCRQLGRHINIDDFIAYYSVDDWLDDNGMPINWKRKIVSWSMRQKEKIEKPQSINDGLF